MKSFTDLEQSKKLAEILPLESADMWWSRCTIADFGDGVLKVSYAVEPCNISQFRNTKEDIPCWSLAALLEIIKKLVGYSLQSLDTHTVFMNCELGDKPYNIETENYDNPIDVCVEMIVKLHGLNLL